MELKEGWSRQQTLKLIHELKQREHLYKFAHPDYLKTHKRKEAIGEIAAALQPLRTNITVNDVKKKIKVLQQQILAEKKKMRAAMRSGMAADDFMSKLWCFNELRFLLDANDEIAGQSHLKTDRLDDPLCESECSYSSLEKSKSSRLREVSECSYSNSIKAKRSRLQEVSALQQSANKSMQLVASLIDNRYAKEDGKEETFCKMLCCELKELKSVETYEDVTTEMLLMLRKAKSDERERLSWQLPRNNMVSTTDINSESESLI